MNQEEQKQSEIGSLTLQKQTSSVCSESGLTDEQKLERNRLKNREKK